MKKQELFDILCNGRKIYSNLTGEEMLDTMHDLAIEFYEKGVPKPEDIMVESKSIEE
jgi:hypothetical protein